MKAKGDIQKANPMDYNVYLQTDLSCNEEKLVKQKS